MIAKRIALGFGIALVFPMLIHHGVSTFVSSPKWEDYQSHSTFDPYAPPAEKAKREAESESKRKLYNAAEKHFQQRLFAVAVPLGLSR